MPVWLLIYVELHLNEYEMLIGGRSPSPVVVYAEPYLDRTNGIFHCSVVTVNQTDIDTAVSSQHYLEIDKANTYITVTFNCFGSLNKALKTSLYCREN